MKRVLRVSLLLLAVAGFVRGQEPEIAPGESLVAEGIPKISRSLAEEVGHYTEFRQAFFSSWHPVERRVLILTRFADTYQVHEVRSPLGARRQLTFFSDGVRGALYQPTSGDFFLFSKDRGGDEFFQAYRYDLRKGAMTLLTDGKSRNTGERWANAGDRVAYGSTRRNGKDVDLWVMRPAEAGSARLLAELSGGGWAALDWSPDDRKILLLEEVSANESYLWLVDSETGERGLLTPKGGKEKIFYGGGAFAKDGRGIYVTTDRESEFQRLASVDLATKKHTYLTTHINWDVDEFELSPDGRTIAFVTNEAGASVLRLLDTTTGKERAVPGLPVGIIEGLKWHKNGREIAFNLQTSRFPSDAFSLDVVTGKVERWTESETGGLDTSTFAEPEPIRWPSFDGRTIAGFLYRPAARFTGKRPVVVNIHGGPESQFRPGFLGRNNYYLNELGVAIIFPNVRGSSGFGKNFLKLDNGTLREDSVRDIGALLDWIKTHPDLDADRILIAGGSYGGYMTLASAVHFNDRIRCSVDVVGISNFVTFLQNTSGYRQDLRRVEYGDERDPKMREFLMKISPLTSASQITKPLFVVQGKNDPRVPASESEQMVATVRKSGAPVWYLLAKDEGHGFQKKKNSDFQFYATVLFVREFLLK